MVVSPDSIFGLLLVDVPREPSISLYDVLLYVALTLVTVVEPLYAIDVDANVNATEFKLTALTVTVDETDFVPEL